MRTPRRWSWWLRSCWICSSLGGHCNRPDQQIVDLTGPRRARCGPAGRRMPTRLISTLIRACWPPRVLAASAVYGDVADHVRVAHRAQLLSQVEDWSAAQIAGRDPGRPRRAPR
ncbi:hypothetical protein HBB16_02110 [Pseudonocardia sp. MCCB 268]|nr:hypothetical protein [Pseudonocardia cytotoxica]